MGKSGFFLFGSLCAAVICLAQVPAQANPTTGCNFPASGGIAGVTSLNPIGCLVYSTNGPIHYNGVVAGGDTYNVTLNSFEFYQTAPMMNEAILTGSYVDLTHPSSGNFTDMAPLTGAVSITTPGPLSFGSVFDFNVDSLVVTDGDLGPFGFFELASSPESTGHAEVVDNGDGTYNITDFFDLYTEMSFDDNKTIIPGSSDMQLAIENVPEPGTVALFLAALMGLGLISRRRYVHKV